jgi:hypothetical protein
VSKSIIGRRPARVGLRDGRSAEAVLLRRTRAALIAHVGGSPSVTQAALIDRAAVLTMHLARFDARAMEKGGLTPHARREYLAYCGAHRRTMLALGLEASAAPQAPAADLATYLATHAATGGNAGHAAP